MDRRHFFKTSGTVYSGLALATTGFLPINSLANIHAGDFPAWLLNLVKLNDEKVPGKLQNQITNKADPDYGGAFNSYRIPNPHSTSSLVETLGVAYASEPSRYYKSPEIRNALALGVDYMLQSQHEDGSIDLYSTNFHSCPDTGFIVNWLTPVYLMLSNLEDDSMVDTVANFRKFLINAGEILKVGGVHTPNHRWVVSAALSWVNRINPDEAYVARADEWLREGISIDPDGQFHEQSTTVYSPLTDRVLIMIARNFDRPEYLDMVRKNLEMTMYYMHPNGEVVTEASGRQDQYQVGYMIPYYYPYRYMAIRDNNRDFAAMCRYIEKNYQENLTNYLNYLIQDQSVWESLPEPGNIPVNYEKAFTYSGVYRIRRGNIDATIIKDNPTFFTFHKGDAVLQAIRFASAFFGKGQFKAESVEKNGNQYILKQSMTAPYYQPYPEGELPEDSDWKNLPRDNRPKSEVQEMDMEVIITEENEKFTLEISLTGTDNVPVAIELGFREDGQLRGVHHLAGVQEGYLLKGGYGEYEYKDQIISFGPGKGEHQWVQLRGAEDKLPLKSVYITGYTPFNQVIDIG